ncbi:MAG: MGMT family protein [Nanoarchaeota archaeon]|nr:MGMT family protein [Nanoarchaeota archaeon]
MATEFQERVYEVSRKIPAGRVSTYKAIADALGVKAYRAVGMAMKSNPYWPDVPCHRIVASDGSLGGFAKGVAEKKRLLEAEGVEIVDGKIKDFSDRIFRF